MKNNIYLMYVHTFLTTFILFYICDTLFFMERGLTTSQYISFVGIVYFIQFIFEIPFGIIADKYNKKLLLISSNILFIVSIIIFIYSHNYLTFLIAIIIKALSGSLSSGIINSILYENIKKKEQFNKVLFYNSFFYNISYMLAMILGGYIGEKFGLVNTYYITIIPFIMDFFILLIIKINQNLNDTNMEKNIFILKSGIKELKDNSYLLKLIFRSSLLFSGIKLIEESHPEYSTNIGLSIFTISIYTSLILLFCIIGNYLGSKINKDKYNFILNINPIIVGIFILFVGLLNNCFGIVFLLLIYIFLESFDNIMLSELHNNISSKSRVTIESIKQFILGIFGVCFSLLMTILLKTMDVNTMYIVIGLIIILFSLLSIIKIQIKRKNL